MSVCFVFLSKPKTRTQIADFLEMDSVSYAIKTYIMPLVEKGIVKMSDPTHPRSKSQKFYTEGYGGYEW